MLLIGLTVIVNEIVFPSTELAFWIESVGCPSLSRIVPVADGLPKLALLADEKATANVSAFSLALSSSVTKAGKLAVN